MLIVGNTDEKNNKIHGVSVLTFPYEPTLTVSTHSSILLKQGRIAATVQ